MKSLFGFLVLCMLGFAGAMWYLNAAGGDDPGVALPVAIGKSNDGALDFHAAVQRDLTTIEPPRVAGRGKPVWNEWVADHFLLVDEQGQRVSLLTGNASKLIPSERARTPEFFMRGELLPGVRYTLDYIPMKSSRLHYRVEFTAPPEGLPFERMLLEEVIVD